MAVSLQRNGALVSLLAEAPADPADGARYIEALGRLSQEREPFVLLVDIRIEIALSDAQRKAQNLWYKAEREQLEKGCRACALVRPAADENMQRVWQSLFGFPVLVTRSRAEAGAFLNGYAPKDYVK